MKTVLSKLEWLLPVLPIAGLLAFPHAVSEAASGAALLWWSSVLPSLLPYLIAASLLLRSGVPFRVRPPLLPPILFLCGALSGYPVGAKTARALAAQNVLDRTDAERVAICCNLPNPVFLFSVVSIGLFGEPRCALPLLIAVYGAAMLFALPLLRIRIRRVPDARCLAANDLPDAIGDGVRTIGVIGGCLVFASVLGAMLDSIALPRALQTLSGIPEPFVDAVILGLFEMTCGVRAAAALPASLSLRMAFAAFFVQLGGLSVLLQTASQYPVRFVRYARIKLPCAALSAALAYLLTPVFLPDAPIPTFASAAEIRQNAFSLLAVVFAAALGLLFVFLFTCGLSGAQKRHPPV